MSLMGQKATYLGYSFSIEATRWLNFIGTTSKVGVHGVLPSGNRPSRTAFAKNDG